MSNSVSNLTRSLLVLLGIVSLGLLSCTDEAPKVKPTVAHGKVDSGPQAPPAPVLGSVFYASAEYIGEPNGLSLGQALPEIMATLARNSDCDPDAGSKHASGHLTDAGVLRTPKKSPVNRFIKPIRCEKPQLVANSTQKEPWLITGRERVLIRHQSVKHLPSETHVSSSLRTIKGKTTPFQVWSYVDPSRNAVLTLLFITESLKTGENYRWFTELLVENAEKPIKTIAKKLRLK